MKQKGNIYAAIAVIGWGTMFIACKISLEVFSSITILFLRYAICLAALIIIYSRKPRQKIEKKDRKIVIFIGVIGYFVGIEIQLYGTSLVDASMASLVNTITPVGIIVFALFILHEKSSVQQIIGILFTVVGACVVVGGAGGQNSFWGIMVCIVGMLIWSYISVVIRKTCSRYDAIWLTIYTSAIATLCSLPFSAADMIRTGLRAQIMPKHIIAILWIGLICTAGANLWWNKALEVMNAAKCSLFYALLPVTTSVLGIFMLGEKITLNFIIGGLLIVGGMVFAVASEAAFTKKKIKTSIDSGKD